MSQSVYVYTITIYLITRTSKISLKSIIWSALLLMRFIWNYLKWKGQYMAIRDVLLVAKSMLMHIIGIIVVIGSHDQQSQL